MMHGVYLLYKLFEGSWEEYAAWVRETRGAEALEPHRIRYKPLVRPGA